MDGVAVLVEGLGRGALTDSLGEYRIESLTFPGRYAQYRVEANRLGYITETRELWLRDFGGGTCIDCGWNDDTTLVLNFSLRPAPLTIEF